MKIQNISNYFDLYKELEESIINVALCSGEIFKLLEIGCERKIEHFYNSIVIKVEELSKTAVKGSTRMSDIWGKG